MIGKKLKSIFNGVLTVFIVVQVCLCMVLMLRSISGKDMAVFGYRFYYIVSPSMEPTIPVGSQIVVKETDPETLAVGDIITFVSRDPTIAGRPNTHRIESIVTEAGKLAFVTQGDNNPTPDSQLVYPHEIYGEVVLIAPSWQGLITFYSFASTPMGFVVIIVMPLLLVMSMFLRSFTKTVKESREQEQTLSEADAAMIGQLVQQYLQEHPDQELTLEQANCIAADLIKAAGQIGAEGAEE